MRYNIFSLLLLSGLFLAAPCAQQTCAAQKLTVAEIEELVAPIALYPDPLLGLMLPAAVFPDQIIDAALLIKSQSDADLIAKQTWDASVKGVATYPGILKMMYEKLDWTTKLGVAFVEQSNELRDSIQGLRLKAEEVGNLKSSPEQQVSTKEVNGQSIVIIEPTQPQIVYVPQYNTEVVYREPAPASSNYLAPLATFGLGMALGAAMSDDDDDVYVYGGYPGRVAWYNNDDVDDWVDKRQDGIRDAQEHRQAMSKDRTEFRQDRIESGQTLSPEQRQQAVNKAGERRENYGAGTSPRQVTNSQNVDARKQQAQNRSSAWKSSAADRGYSSGSGWSKSAQGSGGLYRGSNQNAFSGSSSRTASSAYSSRGATSRTSSGFRSGGSQSAGLRSGGGGARMGGGGGRGGGRR